MNLSDRSRKTTQDGLIWIIRPLIFVWIVLSFVLLCFSLVEKTKSLSVLDPGELPGTTFHGWTDQQLQSVQAAIGISSQLVTGALLAASLINLSVYYLVGGMLLWRKSNTWVGLLGGFILISTGPGFSNLLLEQAQIPRWADNIYSLRAVFIWPTFFIMLYLFPNGKFVPRFTRYFAAVPYLLFVVFVILHPGQTWLAPGQWLLVLYGSGGMISQIYRYRRKSTQDERQQTKWIVFALGIFIGSLVLQRISSLFPANSIGTPAGFIAEFFINGFLGSLVASLIPIAIGISILRYRLWDIDVLIRRTLQYSLLTGLLALVYFGGTVVLQGAISQITGERSTSLVTVISTLGIAALFSPLRKIVHDFIDRRFYRQKYNTEQVLAAFRTTVRNEVNLDNLTQSILAVVEETMHPDLLSIWVQKQRPK